MGDKKRKGGRGKGRKLPKRSPRFNFGLNAEEATFVHELMAWHKERTGDDLSRTEMMHWLLTKAKRDFEFERAMYDRLNRLKNLKMGIKQGGTQLGTEKTSSPELVSTEEE